MDTLAYERGYAIRWRELKARLHRRTIPVPSYFKTAKQRESFRAGVQEATSDYTRLAMHKLNGGDA